MGFQINLVPGNKTFDSAEGETILDAALRAGVLLPYGCRDGACGACRGRVLSGEIDHGHAATHALSQADRDAGQALFCCAHARSDLTIEGRAITSAAVIPVRTVPVRVEALTQAAPDVMILELKLPGSEVFQYLPGQYVEVMLPGGRRRAFSLAGAPGHSPTLQLHVRQVPGGQFTGQVFETMKVRDLLRINGPHGSFFLREDSSKPIVLVAGGTGFAPVKAIVEHVLASGSTRSIHLYWGGKHRHDLYLDALAQEWARTHAQLHYIPVLSEPDAGDDWAGRSGLVHQAVMADFPDLSVHQVYVCGAPVMVAAAQRDFTTQCALPDSEFIADSFEFANDVANS